jgi:hypothetical protein
MYLDHLNMSKPTLHLVSLALFGLLVVITCHITNAQGPPPQGGPPPPGFFSRGPPPGPPPPGYSSSSHPPPRKPSSGGLMGWLGSKMPKMPYSFFSSSPSSSSGLRYPPKGGKPPRPYPPPPPPGGNPGFSSILFPSPYGGGGPGGSERAQIYGQKPSSTVYYTTTNTITHDVLAPPGQQHISVGGGRPVMSFISSSPPGAPGLPPSYLSSNPSQSQQYQHPPQQPQQQQQQQISYISSQLAQAPSGNKSPYPSSYAEPQVQSSEHSYGRVVPSYAPAPQPESNIEVVPSQMVSYNQETLSTGHPEYQAALAGMESSQSPQVVPSPNPYYRDYQPQQQEQQQQSQTQQAPQISYEQLQQRYEYQQQRSEQLPQYATDRSDASSGAHIAPIIDMNFDGAASPSAAPAQVGQGQQSYEMLMSSGSHQSQTHSEAPELQGQQYQEQNVNLEDLLSSLNRQYGGQFQIQDPSDLDGQYSHPNEVVVPAPQSQFNDATVTGDLQGAASSQQQQQQQVQILSQGSEQGNPVFEIMADANAPTYNGHPFDINQLISMIEPGAEVEGSAPSASENHETFAPAPDAIQQQQQQGMTNDFDLLRHTNNNLSSQLIITETFKNNNETNASFSTNNNITTSLPAINNDNETNDANHSHTLQNPPEGSNANGGQAFLDFPNKLTLPDTSQFDVLTPFGPNPSSSSNASKTYRRFEPPTQQNSFSVSFSSSSKDNYDNNYNSGHFSEAKGAFRFPMISEKPQLRSTNSPPVTYQTTIETKPDDYYNNSSNDKHPNHNYNYKVTPTKSSGYFIAPVIPTINPYLDSVETQDDQKIDYDRDLLETEGDLAASGSNQIRSYAITVTPPTHILQMRSKFVASKINKKKETQTSTATSMSPERTTDASTKSPETTTVTTKGFSSNSRFPVFQRKLN